MDPTDAAFAPFEPTTPQYPVEELQRLAEFEPGLEPHFPVTSRLSICHALAFIAHGQTSEWRLVKQELLDLLAKSPAPPGPTLWEDIARRFCEEHQLVVWVWVVRATAAGQIDVAQSPLGGGAAGHEPRVQNVRLIRSQTGVFGVAFPDKPPLTKIPEFVKGLGAAICRCRAVAGLRGAGSSELGVRCKVARRYAVKLLDQVYTRSVVDHLRSDTVIGLIGETGSGKSTLINQALGHELLHTSECGIGTATAIRVVHSDADPTQTECFTATVHLDPERLRFILRTFAILHGELKPLQLVPDGRKRDCSSSSAPATTNREQLPREHQEKLNRYHAYRDALAGLFQPPQGVSILAIANAATKEEGSLFDEEEDDDNDNDDAPHPTGHQAKKRELALRALHGVQQELARATLTRGFSSCEDLDAWLQPYVASSLPADRAEGPHRLWWPVVKSVEIATPHVPPGVVLVDLPGLQDSNDLRIAATESVLGGCTHVWFVTDAAKPLKPWERDVFQKIHHRGLLENTRVVLNAKCSMLTQKHKKETLVKLHRKCTEMRQTLRTEFTIMYGNEMCADQLPVMLVVPPLAEEFGEAAGVDALRRTIKLCSQQWVARQEDARKRLQEATGLVESSLAEGPRRQIQEQPRPRYATPENWELLRSGIDEICCVSDRKETALARLAALQDTITRRVVAFLHVQYSTPKPLSAATFCAICRRDGREYAPARGRAQAHNKTYNLASDVAQEIMAAVAEVLDGYFAGHRRGLYTVAAWKDAVTEVVSRVYAGHPVAVKCEAPQDCSQIIESVITALQTPLKDKLEAALSAAGQGTFAEIAKVWGQKPRGEFTHFCKQKMAGLPELLVAAAFQIVRQMLEDAETRLHNELTARYQHAADATLDSLHDELLPPATIPLDQWLAEPLVQKILEVWEDRGVRPLPARIAASATPEPRPCCQAKREREAGSPEEPQTPQAKHRKH